MRSHPRGPWSRSVPPRRGNKRTKAIAQRENIDARQNETMSGSDEPFDRKAGMSNRAEQQARLYRRLLDLRECTLICRCGKLVGAAQARRQVIGADHEAIETSGRRNCIDILHPL